MKNIICEKCRKPVAISDRFCGNCGSKFLGDAQKELFPVEGKWGWDIDSVGDLWFEVENGVVTLSSYDHSKREGGVASFSVGASGEEIEEAILDMGGPHGVSVWSGVEPSFESYLRFLADSWEGSGSCGCAQDFIDNYPDWWEDESSPGRLLLEIASKVTSDIVIKALESDPYWRDAVEFYGKEDWIPYLHRVSYDLLS